MPHNIHTIAFSFIKGNNPKMATQILNRLGSESEFFTLSETALAARLEFKGRILDPSYRKSLLEKAKTEKEFIDGHNIRAIYFTDADYPQRLLECDDAPAMLYALGDTDLNAAHVVSIVGTRNATNYGVNFIERLIGKLASDINNLVIVSGLAFGCDIAAHKEALRLGIPTVGVVAHGLDTLYPSEHRGYAANMVRQGGMILTDYTHNTTPHRGNFLARNRIVAGLADCIVVAESAANRGGALHTAKLGMLYNRDVFALPGRTSDLYSGGCNMLIKSNVAHLIENADDLVAAMNWQQRQEEGAATYTFLRIHTAATGGNRPHPAKRRSPDKHSDSSTRHTRRAAYGTAGGNGIQRDSVVATRGTLPPGLNFSPLSTLITIRISPQPYNTTSPWKRK